MMFWAAPALAEPPRVEIVGYLDVGAFVTVGDGIAYERSVGAELLTRPGNPGWVPELHELDAAWVFWGDPWANAVNSQGESADLGSELRNPLRRPDRIASGGGPTMLVNALSPGMTVTSGPVSLRTWLMIEPGDADLGALGDAVSVDVAYLEWAPDRERDLRLSVGKIESPFGYEYRFRRAPDRHGITPSLIARYTAGAPVGIKARGSLLHGNVPFSVGLTNGAPFFERFGHFGDDIDTNGAPTVSGRIGWASERRLRTYLGLSGLYGVQDGQPDTGIRGWQAGADARFDTARLSIRGELVRSVQPGAPGTETDRLLALGGYVQVHGWIQPWLAPLVRVERRQAELQTHGNLYLTDVARLTVGCRFDIDESVIAKVEYLAIFELFGDPIPDDVLTSSLVYHF